MFEKFKFPKGHVRLYGIDEILLLMKPNLVGHKYCMDTTLENRQWSSTLYRKI